MKPPKIQRWVDFLAVLLSHRFPVSQEELIAGVPAYQAGDEKAESRRRTFERDKRELKQFGIPIETVEDENGNPSRYRLPVRDFYLPYLALRLQGRVVRPRRVSKEGYRALTELTFEPDELEAITHAAARVRALGDPLLTEDAESALRKLAVDLPMDATQPDATHVAPTRTPADAEVFAELSKALHARKRVSFVYHSIGSDQSAPRTVEPFGLFFLNQHWYLAGRTPGEAKLKNYRLSRISEPRMSPQKHDTPDYEIPAGFRLAEHARSRQAWELGDGDTIEAIVEVRRAVGAAAAAARLGEPVEGHPTRRRFRVRRRDAFARWMLSFAGDLTPVSPPDVVQEYRVLTQETLAHHAGDRLTSGRLTSGRQ
jgi:predicted DNA-binding transcriptional regulator YafY